MKVLTGIKEKHMLEAGLETLHKESLEWLNAISLWREESSFYNELLNNRLFHNITPNDRNNITDLVKSIIGDKLMEVEREIKLHEKKLNELIKTNSKDTEYRSKHKQLNKIFEELEERMILCKRGVYELFKLVNTNNAVETIDTINERRSVRRFKKEEIEKKEIEKIIQAGRMAPSAMNKQPWKFYVLNNSEKIKKYSTEIANIAEHLLHLSLKKMQKEEDPIFHGAPVVIFIAAEEDNDWAPLDIGMCAQNIMLAAKALGYDTCPIGLAKAIENTPNYKEMQIPETEKILIAIALGKGEEKPVTHKRAIDNLVYLN